jgi:hypothetical protein
MGWGIGAVGTEHEYRSLPPQFRGGTAINEEMDHG